MPRRPQGAEAHRHRSR